MNQMSSVPYSYAGATLQPPSRAKCAYVALVWGGTRYVPGALVAAASLRRVGARHDLVCMVTPDVPEVSRARLRQVYDHVVAVDVIARESRKFQAPRQGKLYNGWIDTSYTKWNALRLTSYDLVLVFDADMLFLTNCDDLFELRPPAACFSMPWDSGTDNHYLREGRPPAHGETVSAETIRAALCSDLPSFVGCTWTTLLKPNLEAFDRLVGIIHEEAVYAEGCHCVNGPDEISLAQAYATLDTDFQHISPRYAAIPWHRGWADTDCRALHFHGGTKPWEVERGAWPDLPTWWSVADALSSKFPGILAPPPAGGPGKALLSAGSPGQLGLTHRLRQTLADCVRTVLPGREKKAQSEADNCLERWAIALANAGSRSYPFWPTALEQSGEAANAQLVKELTELSPSRDPSPATAALRAALAAIDGAGSEDLAGPFELRDGSLTCPGAPELARGIPADRLRLLVGLGGLEATGRMALSYEVLAPGGCQWRIPQDHADYLYACHDVRNEGFASPLNSNFIGRVGAAYYSLYPKADSPFGSSGSFFEADLSRGGGWLINPPFIENILEIAARRVRSALDAGPKAPLSVFFVMPAWTDSAAYRILSNSKHLLAMADLAPGQYYYETPSGKKVHTGSPSVYFALSSDHARAAQMRTAIARFGGAATAHLGRGPVAERARSVRPALDDGSPGWAAPRVAYARWPSLAPPDHPEGSLARSGGARCSRTTLWPKRDGYHG